MTVKVRRSEYDGPLPLTDPYDPGWLGNRRRLIVMQNIAIEPSAVSRRWRGIALVAGAAVAWSIAGIITRLTAVDAWTTLFWRSVFAAAFLSCYIAFKEHGDWRGVVKRFG